MRRMTAIYLNFLVCGWNSHDAPGVDGTTVSYCPNSIVVWYTGDGIVELDVLYPWIFGDVVEEPEYHLVRTKRFAVKPMSTEEAILQMNLLDHSFYVFRSVETGNICVVYHRNNGGYGLIETE
mgnify:CR=1 FL=1